MRLPLAVIALALRSTSAGAGVTNEAANLGLVDLVELLRENLLSCHGLAS